MLEPLAERLTRFGLGLAALGSLAWLLWPTAEWRPDAEPAFAFASALAIWTVAELRSVFRRPPHPHDVAFIRELRSMIPLSDVRWLEQQDFGVTYDNDRLDGFWQLDFDAQATGYGPYDRYLKRKFEVLRERVREFGLLLVTHGGPIRGNSRLASIVPDLERATDEFSDETWALVRKVNGQADVVVAAFNDLMQEAKGRVPDAFG